MRHVLSGEPGSSAMVTQTVMPGEVVAAVGGGGQLPRLFHQLGEDLDGGGILLVQVEAPATEPGAVGEQDPVSLLDPVEALR